MLSPATASNFFVFQEIVLETLVLRDWPKLFASMKASPNLI
jgi:hypothetical protein